MFSLNYIKYLTFVFFFCWISHYRWFHIVSKYHQLVVLEARSLNRGRVLWGFLLYLLFIFSIYFKCSKFLLRSNHRHYVLGSFTGCITNSWFLLFNSRRPLYAFSFFYNYGLLLWVFIHWIKLLIMHLVTLTIVEYLISIASLSHHLLTHSSFILIIIVELISIESIVIIVIKVFFIQIQPTLIKNAYWPEWLSVHYLIWFLIFLLIDIVIHWDYIVWMLGSIFGRLSIEILII